MSHFYKMGQQRALLELGLLKDAQTSYGTRPTGAPPPAKTPPPPKPPPPKNPPLIGQGQRKTLRGEGVFGM